MSRFSNKTQNSHFFNWISVFISLEFLSWLAYNFGQLNYLVLILIALLTVILCWRKPIYLLYIPIAELAWGSLGHSFQYNMFSTRMVVFLAVVLVFVLSNFQIYKIKFFRDKSLVLLYLFIWIFIIAGFMFGYFRGFDLQNIFLDGNAYIFLIYLPIWYQVYQKKYLSEIWQIIKTGALVLAIKTIIIFNLFVQDYSLLDIERLYKWIRDTRTGEITPFGEGFFRVFLQGQFYLLVAWFYLFLKQLKDYKDRSNFIYLIIISAALLISLSRSFWLGGLIGLLFLLINIFIYQRRHLSPFIFAILIGILVASSGIVLLFYNIPRYYGFNILAQRSANVSEAAVSSRSQLLVPMWDSIKESSIIGYGFGKELTYQSADPRIRNEANPDGWYTTYSFEWGWLDMWLKAGIFFVSLFLMWLWQIYQRGYTMLNTDPIAVFTLFASITSLIIIHIFTPYINHPLGLGLIMLATVIFGPYAKKIHHYY